MLGTNLGTKAAQSLKSADITSAYSGSLSATHKTKRQRRGRRAQPGIARDLGDRQLGPTTAQPLGRPSGNVDVVGIDAAVATG